MAKITVQNTEVNVIKVDGEDYICLTDMLRAKDGDFFITDWLRNRNTLEYIGIWEKLYNSNFNYGEFAIIRNQSGLNSFKISVKEFVARTNAISVQAKAGRYGGTYAHKDIAFEFAMWISPEFKIYIVKEFQRLKTEEQHLLGWSAKRELSKINYRIHTDAIKQNLIPAEVTPKQASIIYANEADVLNVAMICLQRNYGCQIVMYVHTPNSDFNDFPMVFTDVSKTPTLNRKEWLDYLETKRTSGYEIRYSQNCDNEPEIIIALKNIGTPIFME